MATSRDQVEATRHCKPWRLKSVGPGGLVHPVLGSSSGQKGFLGRHVCG